MKRLLLLLSLTLVTPFNFSAELDVLSNKPLKQLHFRHSEGSLKNMEQDKWIKRWGRFDGIVLKAWNEEITGFSKSTDATLSAFKATYPQKALILHFNGRAVLPEFGKQYLNANDYLYYLGTNSNSELVGESESTIKVDNISAFYIRETNRNAAQEDVVIVERNSDGTLNWKNTEHAKLISINTNNTITVKRDILGTGKLTLNAKQAYVAQHVSKGPFAKESQRLWEYNWFKFSNTPHGIFNSLPSFLAARLSSDFKFFDGIQFDVLTETHRTVNFGYPMPLDADADGKRDEFSMNAYDNAHKSGVYAFLSNLRAVLPKNTILLADGDYIHQKATWLLNGIESERWPTIRDPKLEQWSSGINRHLYWQKFGLKPTLSYMKVAEFHLPGKGAVSMPDNIRRLIVAAGVLTNSAVVPAFRPNGLVFHKWPEFRKLKNIGEPKSEIVVLTSEPLEPVQLKDATKLKKASILFDAEVLNNRSPKITAKQCLVMPDKLKSVSLKLTASTQSTNKDIEPLNTPTVFYIGNETHQQKTFLGDQPFTAWFSWHTLNASPLCFALSDDSRRLNIDEISISRGLKVEARVFEKAILFTNNNDTVIKLDADDLKPLKNYLPIETLLKGSKELHIPAKDNFIYRY